MIDIPLVSKILIPLIDIIGIWLAFWIYSTNRKSKINIYFSLVVIFVLLWITFAYFANITTQSQHAVLWIKLTFIAVFSFFSSLYFFVIFFPREEIHFYLLDKFVITLMILLALISFFTDLLVKDVAFYEWGVSPIWGNGQPYIYGIIFLFTLLILWILFKKYFKLSPNEKLKVQYFLLGMFFFIVMNLIFNVILSSWLGVFPYYNFGNYSAIFLLGFTALVL